jgi:hypothetical protein
MTTNVTEQADPPDSLHLEYLGDEFLLLPGDDLRFGRNSDLVIDENPFMHRVVGRFVHREGVWWLQNHGTRLRLELMDSDTGAVLEAAPGQQIPVLGTAFVMRFSAGPTSYEVGGRRSGNMLKVGAAGEVVGTETIDFGSIPLSPEQHLVLVAMYESRLRLGGVEGNTVLAKRLGWPVTKYNRKLDTICDKLTRAGVRGVKGGRGVNAEGRREALVSYAVRTGLVGPNDIDLLRAAVSGAGEVDPQAS